MSSATGPHRLAVPSRALTADTMVTEDSTMATELPKQYDPQEAQQRWLRFWDERGYFHSRPDADAQPFTIVIPPPNVTGALHMGHALNNTLQDVLIRWRRMQGYNALWMPGTDHAGIATQAVVERRLRDEEKKTRHDLGREELVSRIWEWKDQYEARILGQLKRARAAAATGSARASRSTRCAPGRCGRRSSSMFRDGLIFRGKRLVNWDTQLQTSVADDETLHEDVKGGFWTFRYPVKGSERVHPLLDDAARNDARRHGRGRASERRALQAPDRQDGDDPAGGPRHSDHRRWPAGGPGARHRRREGDAGPRSERLRLRPAAQAADDQHPQPRRHDQRERRPVRGPGPLQGPRSA